MDGEVEVDDHSGGELQPHLLERRLSSLAGRQHGVAARVQLAILGFTHRQIDRRVRAGRLIPIHRGVYAVGHTCLTRRGRWMAAVLAGGSGAVLSHASAAMLWDLIAHSPSRPEVTLAVKGRRRPAITWHCASMPADEVTVRDGIPVTTVPRTILDLAATGNLHRAERALAEAEYRRYADRLSLPDLLGRHSGERGTASLRRMLVSENASLGVTRSVLEERFIVFCDDFEIPRPELNATLDLGARHVIVDCLWRPQRLIVELDGFAAHGGSRQRFEADAARQRALMACGWGVMPVTWRDLHGDPGSLAAEILMALGPGEITTGRIGTG